MLECPSGCLEGKGQKLHLTWSGQAPTLTVYARPLGWFLLSPGSVPSQRPAGTDRFSSAYPADAWLMPEDAAAFYGWNFAPEQRDADWASWTLPAGASEFTTDICRVSNRSDSLFSARQAIKEASLDHFEIYLAYGSGGSEEKTGTVSVASRLPVRCWQ